jgi:hypothetical protein
MNLRCKMRATLSNRLKQSKNHHFPPEVAFSSVPPPVAECLQRAARQQHCYMLTRVISLKLPLQIPRRSYRKSLDCREHGTRRLYFCLSHSLTFPRSPSLARAPEHRRENTTRVWCARGRFFPTACWPLYVSRLLPQICHPTQEISVINAG